VPVALERGYFEKNGLDVDLLNWAGSTDQMLESLATGKADVGVGMIHRWVKPLEAGFDVKVVGSSHGGCLRLVGAKAAGVTTDLASLKGKTIGVSDIAAPRQVLCDSPGQERHRHRPDVDLARLPGRPARHRGAEGRDPGHCRRRPERVPDREAQPGRLHRDCEQRQGRIRRAVCCIVGARGELARNDKPRRAALVRALAQASDYVSENPNEAAKIYSKYAPKVPVEDLQKLLAELTLQAPSGSARPARRGGGLCHRLPQRRHPEEEHRREIRQPRVAGRARMTRRATPRSGARVAPMRKRRGNGAARHRKAGAGFASLRTCPPPASGAPAHSPRGLARAGPAHAAMAQQGRGLQRLGLHRRVRHCHAGHRRGCCWPLALLGTRAGRVGAYAAAGGAMAGCRCRGVRHVGDRHRQARTAALAVLRAAAEPDRRPTSKTGAAWASTAHSARLLANGFVLGALVGLCHGRVHRLVAHRGLLGASAAALPGPVPASALLPLAFFFAPSSYVAAVFLMAPGHLLSGGGAHLVGRGLVNKSYYDVARTLGASERFLVLRVAFRPRCRRCSWACSWAWAPRSRC
jgi:NitT/TauT family transport system substrate-binding protein